MADETGHTWEVIQATTRPDFKVEVDDKHYSFGNGYAFRVDDGGIAKEIEAKYGREVVVDRITMPDVHDRGHKYFFGGWPEMPWKRKDKEDALQESGKIGLRPQGREVAPVEESPNGAEGDSASYRAEH